MMSIHNWKTDDYPEPIISTNVYKSDESQVSKRKANKSHRELGESSSKSLLKNPNPSLGSLDDYKK